MKCWKRPPSKHANWTFFCRRYWLNLLPSFTSVINGSLLTGSFPSVFKSAIVRPLVKKHTLDSENLKNNRPISILPFLSKITEKIVFLQLSQHLESNSLLYPLQSAYCSGHSTETALLKIVNDLLAALDVNHISLLSLLDLSAALDTIDHSILLSRLHHTFSISGTALSWFQSYPSDWTQVVSVNGASFAPAALNFSVPQRSVLGPILFVLYSIIPILFLNLCPITLFHIIVSLMTTSCTNLATLLNFLKLFIQLSLVSLM